MSNSESILMHVRQVGLKRDVGKVLAHRTQITVSFLSLTELWLHLGT